MVQFSASECSHVKQDSSFWAHFCGVFLLVSAASFSHVRIDCQLKGQPFSNRRMIDQVQTTRLADGLTILTEHMPGLRSVSFGIWVRRGSRHETPALNGICHFIEHSLFKGSNRRSARQIAVESDRLGGHLDAYTAHEITGFALKVVDTALPQAFDLLADLVANPR